MNNDNFDLSMLFRLWWQHRWKLCIGLLVGVLIGAAYYVITPPCYKAEAIVVPIGSAGSIGSILGIETDTIRAHDEETQLMMELMELREMDSRVKPASLKVRRTIHFNVVLSAEATRASLADSAIDKALSYYDTLKTEKFRQRMAQQIEVLTLTAQRLDSLASLASNVPRLIIQKAQAMTLSNLVDIYRSTDGLVFPQYILLQRSLSPAPQSSPTVWFCVGIGLLIGLMVSMFWIAIRK